jgi:hypothetical protein
MSRRDDSERDKKSGRYQQSNSGLSERLARVEEKQERTLDKIDLLVDRINADLDGVETKLFGTVLPQHRKLWLTYEAIRWGVAFLAASGLVVYLLPT